MQEYCVCNHEESWHYYPPYISRTCNFRTEKHTEWMPGTYYQNCSCNNFTLDNLRLIEDLAKQRNLI